MKKVIAASAMAMVLATGAMADLKVGLGYTVASANGIDNVVGTPANIRVPIDFDFGLRIEPELGFGTRTDTSNPVDLTDTTQTVAVGGYYNLWNVEKVNFYAGGRLSYTSTDDERFNPTGADPLRVTSTTDTVTAIQGLFGAEYMFTEDFSFGAQAGLEIGSYDNEGGSKGSQVGSVAHLLIHYFF